MIAEETGTKRKIEPKKTPMPELPPLRYRYLRHGRGQKSREGHA